ncbi:MAG: putative toxin-antitoxin system toxin component, PIN family [Bacteroidales bacterium]|nr:putative toxin-antitoxin system toxin component, PIN family [Bacteroidales bacterium]MBQ2573705.1 putative toxin-antitoxin system toxin component, PIN family [Bacteroidales bacterium]
MRIVLDTNSLIQSIPKRSAYRVVWDSILSGENILCVSNEIIEEYVEILQQLTNSETANIIIEAIVNSPFVEYITPYYRFNLIKADPDDNKFVDCAISANAHYIVTNDHHYDVLKDIAFPRVDVIALKEFFELINRNY